MGKNLTLLRLFFLSFLLVCIAFSKDIAPTFRLKSAGVVSDFIVVGERVYVASDAGVVEIFSLKTQKLLEFIALEPLTSAFGELLPAKILSIDYRDGKLLIVSIGNNAYRNVWLYEKHTLKKIVDESQKLTIKKALFVNDTQILLATFASEIILHDTKEQYNLYKKQISQSTLGDIALSEDAKSLAFADESGEVRLLDINSSKELQNFKPMNLDNVYHIAYAHGVIVTAGQDRRVAIYRDGEKESFIKSDFLVYCVGISPSGKTAIYSSNEAGDLQLFKTATKEKLDTLTGHKALINQIKFINENELLSSERSNYIYYWKI